MRTPHTVFQNRRSLKRTRTLIVLVIVVALLGINSGPRSVTARSSATQSAVFQTTTVPILAGTAQPINNGPGRQTDPHVSCEMVSYTNDDDQGTLQIQYFDIATNTDHIVPGNGANSLSDISNGRIAFTEGTPSGPQIVIFDTATQTRSVVPGFWHRRSGLGGNTVAYEDRSFSDDASSINTPAEMRVYDPTSGINPMLTIDALFDRNPAVSPTGNAVVWEKCQTLNSGCDIYSTIRIGPATFQIRALTGAGEDSSPDTNGQIAAYLSDKSGENDIYYQPLQGGTEIHVPIPGNQRGVSIFENLIAFESEVQLGSVTQYDIFVYDVSAGNLYQVTSTPVNETLSDIAICNGIGRIVYAVPGDEFDIYAFTFQLPSSTPNQVEDLIELVQSFNLPPGTANSLLTKLQDALAAIDASDNATACDCLSSFINECQAQSGKKLSPDQSSQLINAAAQVKTDLGCQ